MSGVGLAAIVMAGMVALMGPLPVQKGSGYSVQDLGTLWDASESHAWRINNRGRVVGQSSGRAFLWIPGYGMYDLNMTGSANGINDQGEVVGSDDLWLKPSVAFHYYPQGNQVQFLPATPEFSQALAINSAGVMVGVQGVGGIGRARRWNGQPNFFLPGLGGPESTAVDINDSGVIVGSSQIAGPANPPYPPHHAVRWTDAGVEDLGTLGGPASRAAAINGAGAIVGWAQVAPFNEHAFRWTAATGMQDLGTLGGVYSQARDINTGGVIVGWATISIGLGRAFIWDRFNGMWNLNALLPASSGWELIEANGINDKGQVVGWGWKGGRAHAYLLTPLPPAPPVLKQ